VFGVLALSGAWIGSQLLRFTFHIFDRFPYMIAR
jgi:flagellar biosynthetic protein FliQ